MNFEDYQHQSRFFVIYKESDKIFYPTLGLTSEAGEVAGKVKKMVRDDQGELTEERRSAIVSEIGDCLWYLAQLCTDLNVNLGHVAEENLEKLNSRLARNVVQGSGDNR